MTNRLIIFSQIFSTLFCILQIFYRMRKCFFIIQVLGFTKVFHDEVCKVNISYTFHNILQHLEGTWKQAGGPNSAPPEVTL